MWEGESTGVAITLFEDLEVELRNETWENPIESGDVLAMKAKKVIELVKEGVTLKDAAEEVGISPTTLTKTRPDILAAIANDIDLYGNMPPAIRKAHIRAVKTKIMMDNAGGSVKEQELALKAAIAMSDDHEVGIYQRANAVVVREAPPISESFAKLLDAAPLPPNFTEIKE